MVAWPPERRFLNRVKNGGDMIFEKSLVKKEDIRIPNAERRVRMTLK